MQLILLQIQSQEICCYLRLKTLKEAQRNTKMAMQGIVINPSIEAAVLLILGSLYDNREDETSTTVNELPKGALWLLDPYRLDLGV
jgi:hypothetical protein